MSLVAWPRGQVSLVLGIYLTDYVELSKAGDLPSLAAFRDAERVSKRVTADVRESSQTPLRTDSDECNAQLHTLLIDWVGHACTRGWT